MTYQPADLGAVLAYLNSKGAPWDSLGCVAGPADRAGGGYHCGHDWLHDLGRAPEDPGSDYSYAESQRDRNGLTDAASAIDFAGASWWHDLTLYLVAACRKGAPGTEDIREIIYTPDLVTVARFDRLGIRSTGDSSHLWHTHISFFRDSEGRRDGPFLGLLKRYFGDMAPVTVPKGDEEMIIATGGGQLYLCNGIESRPISQADAANLFYLAKQGTISLATGMPGAEWDATGRIRTGWNEATYGPVRRDAGQLTDAQVAAIADRVATALVQSGANDLTAKDHAAIMADVKAVLAGLSAVS